MKIIYGIVIEMLRLISRIYRRIFNKKKQSIIKDMNAEAELWLAGFYITRKRDEEIYNKRNDYRPPSLGYPCD